MRACGWVCVSELQWSIDLTALPEGVHTSLSLLRCPLLIDCFQHCSGDVSQSVSQSLCWSPAKVNALQWCWLCQMGIDDLWSLFYDHTFTSQMNPPVESGPPTVAWWCICGAVHLKDNQWFFCFGKSQSINKANKCVCECQLFQSMSYFCGELLYKLPLSWFINRCLLHLTVYHSNMVAHIHVTSLDTCMKIPYD